MSRTTKWSLLVLAASLLCTGPLLAQWPNNPDEDPLLAPPNDPGYLNKDGDGNIVGGDWNRWSFVPDSYNVVDSERALGTGMHADRGWQITPGDARIVIAVLDSGIKWDEADLARKYVLNRAELEAIGDDAKPLGPPMTGGDEWDINGDGILTTMDYTINDAGTEVARFDKNENGLIEGQDFIIAFSDGNDDDGNGFVDDIAGWDFFWNDNDPYDDTRFGHGTGEAKDSGAEGNNGIGSLGICPNCSILNMRVGDSFVVDANDFGDAVVYAVDQGAVVIQEALGAMNMTPLATEAIEYAYANNVAVVASAADELSFHHNLPGTTNHTIYVHAVVHDKNSALASTTFLNFNNCTNYGGQLLLSSPGSGCSSEATGVTAGHVGMIYSAAIGPQQSNVTGGLAPLDPPLSSEEVRALLINSVDDIDVDGSENDSTKFPSVEGWDWHFGYGRNNVRTSLDMIVDREIPPEADIVEPLWFEVLWPDVSTSVSITGRVGARVDGLDARYATYDYVLEYALGVDPKEGWKTIKEETGVAAFAGEIAVWDISNIENEMNIDAPAADPHSNSVTVRLRVSAQNAASTTVTNEFRKTFFVHRDPDLFAGFPMHFEGSLEPSMKFANLDDDPGEELIMVTNEGLLHAFKPDGSELPGFPIELGMRKGHATGESGSHEEACAYQDPGSRDASCVAKHGQVNFEVRQAMVGTPAIGDLEGDGSDMEIVVSTFDGYIFAYRLDGSLVPGFPVRTDPANSATTNPDNRLDEGFFASPVLFDLDGDKDLEIINAAMDQHVYVFHHDGSLDSGFPVLLRDESDPIFYNLGERIVASSAVGDIDRDGVVEIISPTNEFYDGNRVRLYIVDGRGKNAPDGPIEGGGPLVFSGLLGEVLPIVGRGIAGAPVLANIDSDPYLEFTAEGIAGRPLMRSWDGSKLIEKAGAYSASPDYFGEKSNSADDGALPLLSNGIFSRLDDSGDLAYVKGTAGYGFALAFASGGERGYFDHQITAWNVNTGLPLVGFPQVVDDWQFIAGPSAADIDGDFNVEVLVGTGGYRVHAFNSEGEVPEGWPKFTGGWIIATPTLGDFDGDGNLDVAVGTRSGWLYVWKTRGGKTDGPIDWRFNNHDLRNTNNYEEPFVGQGGPVDPVEPEPDVGGEDTTDQDTTVPTTDTAADTGSVTGGGGSDDDCGCQTVRTSSSDSPMGLFLVVGALGLVALRRRR